MANHHPYYTQRSTTNSSIQSIVEQYVPTDPSYHSSSSTFTHLDPPSLPSRGPPMMYSLGDGIATRYAPSAYRSGPARVDVDVDVNVSSGGPVYSGYKRPSSEALYHPSHVGTHSAIGQSEGWYFANPLVKHPRFESNLPVYSHRPREPDWKEMSASNNITDTPSISLRSLLEKDKLTGSNFLDWERNLRIVLKQERMLYALDFPIPNRPPLNAPQSTIDAYVKHSNDSNTVTCLMLATMSPNLQERFMDVDAYNMIRSLHEMFQEQARTERYETSKAFHSCKMGEGASVSAHVMKMKGYIDRLERLGYPVAKELATDIILNSLSKDYKQFVINFDMNNMGMPISELHEMLKDVEKSLNIKHKEVLVVRQGRVNTKLDKVKSKIPAKKAITKPKPKQKTKPKIKPEPKPKPKGKIAKDCICHHCNEIGHWRRNCPKYLEELNEKKATGAL